MTWVKVCGLREPDHVAVAEDAGADAVGLVVVAGSPRCITLERARTLASSTSLETFLVMVDATPREVMEAVEQTGVSGIQPHGEHAADAAAVAVAAGLRVLRPVPVTTSLDISDVPEEQIPLLDTAVEGMHGGTGRRWTTSVDVGIDRPWVLAGGLRPDTVRSVVAEMHPWGVDASSGLESSPGHKEAALIRTFIEEARAT